MLTFNRTIESKEPTSSLDAYIQLMNETDIVNKLQGKLNTLTIGLQSSVKVYEDTTNKDVSVVNIDSMLSNILRDTGIDISEITAGNLSVVDSIIEFIKAIFKGIMDTIEALFTAMKNLINGFVNFIKSIGADDGKATENSDAVKEAIDVATQTTEDIATGAIKVDDTTLKHNEININNYIEQAKNILKTFPMLLIKEDIVTDDILSIGDLHEYAKLYIDNIKNLSKYTNVTIKNNNVISSFTVSKNHKGDLVTVFEKIVQMFSNTNSASIEASISDLMRKETGYLYKLLHGISDTFIEEKEIFLGKRASTIKIDKKITSALDNKMQDKHFNIMGYSNSKIYVLTVDKDKSNISDIEDNIIKMQIGTGYNSDTSVNDRITLLCSTVKDMAMRMNLKLESVDIMSLDSDYIEKKIDKLKILDADELEDKGMFGKTFNDMALLHEVTKTMQDNISEYSLESNAHIEAYVKSMDKVIKKLSGFEKNITDLRNTRNVEDAEIYLKGLQDITSGITTHIHNVTLEQKSIINIIAESAVLLKKNKITSLFEIIIKINILHTR